MAVTIFKSVASVSSSTVASITASIPTELQELPRIFGVSSTIKVGVKHDGSQEEVTHLEINFERLLQKCQEYVYLYATQPHLYAQLVGGDDANVDQKAQLDDELKEFKKNSNSMPRMYKDRFIQVSHYY